MSLYGEPDDFSDCMLVWGEQDDFSDCMLVWEERGCCEPGESHCSNSDGFSD